MIGHWFITYVGRRYVIDTFLEVWAGFSPIANILLEPCDVIETFELPEEFTQEGR